MRTLIVVDIESDGPCPGLFSMVCFGAVAVTRELNKTFYAETQAIEGAKWQPEALAISGISRERHLAMPFPTVAMNNFDAWLRQFERPVFISDNLAFDWQFTNWYFHAFGPSGNPFGWSGRRIGDIYGGFKQDIRVPWKNKFRKTAHTHNPVDDAMGNAEALVAFADLGIKGIL